MNTNTTTINAQPVNYKIILALIFGIATILAACFTIGELMITIGSIIDTNLDPAKNNPDHITVEIDDIVLLITWSVMLAFALGGFLKTAKYLNNFKFVSICTVVDSRETVEMV